MSAANTVVENGGRVVLLDKSSFCGGNSTKATSGINGAGRCLDNADSFEASAFADLRSFTLSARFRHKDTEGQRHPRQRRDLHPGLRATWDGQT